MVGEKERVTTKRLKLDGMSRLCKRTNFTAFDQAESTGLHLEYVRDGGTKNRNTYVLVVYDAL